MNLILRLLHQIDLYISHLPQPDFPHYHQQYPHFQKKEVCDDQLNVDIHKAKLKGTQNEK